jgi:uncharacterized protein (TIGR02246 family)
MNIEAFKSWLEAYRRAWEEGDPQAAASIFSADAVYCETPFDEPMRGRDAILRYWSDALGSQDQVKFSYEVLAVSEGNGIARWRASFVRVPSSAQVELDGIFLVRMNSEGQCTQFQEWWHKRERDRK